MDTVTPDVLKGVFRTRQELDAYEKFWHTSIYQPTWDEQAIKVRTLSPLPSSLPMQMAHGSNKRCVKWNSSIVATIENEILSVIER